MSEKSNRYVKKVIANQMGHNPDLTVTPFKNTVESNDNLFEDLGATTDDLSEIALQICDDLEANLYEEIMDCETVAGIESVVASIQSAEPRYDELLAQFEPPKEEKKEELQQVEQTA